jgi:hypothetical protein
MRFLELTYRTNLSPSLFKYRKQVFLGIWITICLISFFLSIIASSDLGILKFPNFLSILVFYLLNVWFSAIIAGLIWIGMYIQSDNG